MPFATVNGVDLYYDEAGSGPPLLFLMGLGMDADAWEQQIPYFAATRRVLRLDNRGAGRSGKPPGPYSIAEMASDTAALLAHLGIARADVVGLSMGGMIAQELAIRYPDRVSALVLAATLAHRDDSVDRTARRGAQQLGVPQLDPTTLLAAKGAFAAGTVDMKQLVGFLMPLILTEDYLRREQQSVRRFVQRSAANGFSIDGFVAQLQAVMAHDTRDRLGGIAAPTLVLTGTADRLTPTRLSDELARGIPGATLVRIEGAPHGLNWENAAVFNREIDAFLSEKGLSA